MRRLTALLVLLWAGVALAQNGPVTGFCDMGSTNAVTSGLSSSNTLQGITPSCLVTIYYTGTSTIVPSANIVTATGGPLGNPFTANSNGSWLFFASYNYGYDVVLSSGVTITGLYPGFVYPSGAQSFGSVTITGAPSNTLVAADGTGYTTPVLPLAIASNKLTTAESVRNYGAVGNGSTDDSAAIVSACGAAAEILFPAGTYKIASNETFNCSPIFQGGASISVPTGVTVTWSKPVTSTLQKIFTVAGTGKVLIPTGPSYPEWWGAVADWSGSTGTDNTAAINAALAAVSSGGTVYLQTGSYLVSSVLTVPANGVGINVVGQGARNTVIYSNSATEDIIDVPGTVGSCPTGSNTYNYIRDFSVHRTVNGTAGVGFNLQYACLLNVDRTESWDSINGYYLHGTTNTFLHQPVAIWTSISTGNTNRVGIEVYSGDGVESSSTHIIDGIVSQTVSLPNLYGAAINGSNVRDLYFPGFETSLLAYGVVVSFSGTGYAGNLQFTNNIHDNCSVHCFDIENVSNAGSPYYEQGVLIQGGYLTAATGTSAVLIYVNNSSGVRVVGTELWNPYAANAAVQGVVLNNSNNNSVVGAMFHEIGYPINVIGSSYNAIAGNTINNHSTLPAVTDIGITSASLGNAITGNTLGGYSTNGIVFDATSGGNKLSGNTVVTANITTPFTDLAAGNSWDRMVLTARQAFSSCSTSATWPALSYYCTVAVTLNGTFPGTNYTAHCDLDTPNTTGFVSYITGKSATGFSVIPIMGASGSSGTLDCTATYDYF